MAPILLPLEPRVTPATANLDGAVSLETEEDAQPEPPKESAAEKKRREKEREKEKRKQQSKSPTTRSASQGGTLANASK